MINLDYLYNPAAVGKSFVGSKLTFQVIEHGTILPHKDTYVNGKWTWGKGGIIDSNGNFVKGSHVSSSIDKIYYPPPSNLFNIALKRSFISVCGSMFGDM